MLVLISKILPFQEEVHFVLQYADRGDLRNMAHFQRRKLCFILTVCTFTTTIHFTGNAFLISKLVPFQEEANFVEHYADRGDLRTMVAKTGPLPKERAMLYSDCVHLQYNNNVHR